MRRPTRWVECRIASAKIRLFEWEPAAGCFVEGCLRVGEGDTADVRWIGQVVETPALHVVVHRFRDVNAGVPKVLRTMG